MEFILMILCAFAAPCIFLLFTYWMDRKRKEPVCQLMKALVLGMVVALISLSFTEMLKGCGWIRVSDISTWGHFKQAFLGAALPEEIGKLVMLWILLQNHKYFNEFLDGIVYSVFIAMGFAIVENLCYMQMYPEQWQRVILGRSLLSVPAHFCYAVIIGSLFSVWYFRRKKGWLLLGVLISITAHGSFDFCLVEMAKTSSMDYLVGIMVFFTILLVAMIVFSYVGVVGSKVIDDRIYSGINAHRWKSPMIRAYSLILVMLCSSMLLGDSSSNQKTATYKLSPELAELRDVYLLPIRKAYGDFLYSGNGELFCLDVISASPYWSRQTYEDTREFYINNYRVRMLDTICSLDSHFCYSPLKVRELADSVYELPIEKTEYMYELIHRINRLSTDGSAAVAQLPICQCQYAVLPAGRDTTIRMEAYGHQELLLVSEFGGELSMQVTDMTTQTHFPAQTQDGTSWLTWKMLIEGESRVLITNPTGKDLSYVLVNLDMRN